MVRHRWVRNVVAALFTVLVLYLVACYSLARSYLSPPRTVPTLPVGLIEDRMGAVPVWTTPHLGHGKVLFVMAHGLGGSRATWGDLMIELDRHGIDCVAPAMPGQDANPDPTVGFGAKEAKTIVETVRWAKGRYPNSPKVVLLGVSMGGAAAWLASEEDPSVAGVVTEGSYARFDEAMTHWFDRRMAYASVLFRPVIWMATAMSGISPEEIVPQRAAERWKGHPALVIQGAADLLILPTHAKRLAQAAGAALWTVPGAGHAECMEIAGTEYARHLIEFTRRL